ncbi:MAG TPA: helix-turn-helix transcriptional regulator [Xanthomonadaceae bacterium]|jgi:transcriptional regulator with XRE-family HTH domain|nr:helix-turn-helix transcriptional regulator [Xanthomonadaceae bacterium]
MPLRHELIVALKRLLKAQGITYAALAKRLDLSEAAVKRMFSQQALSLLRLEQICEVLDIGLSELAAEAHQGPAVLTEIDEQAEQALVEDMPLLLALYLVLNRWTQAEVLAAYRFTLPQWTLLLARLDRMGVIELQPGNRYRVRAARNFRWRRDGPMQQFFRTRLLPEFFRREFNGPGESLVLLSGMLSPVAAAYLQRRLDEAAAEFDVLLAQDAGMPAAQRVGVSLVLAKRPWTLQLFDPLRRTTPD